MDSAETLYADSLIPLFLDNVAVVDDNYRDMGENANFTGLVTIEGSSSIVAGDLQENNAQGLAPLESGATVEEPVTSLFSLCDELRELWVGEHSSWIEQSIDSISTPQERNVLQSFPADPVTAFFDESVLCLYRPEADPVHYAANMDVEYNYENSSRSAPECWHIWDGGPEGNNLECRIDNPPELVPVPEEYLPRLAPPQDLDITGCCGRTETEELDQEPYQLVLQETEWEFLQEIFPVETVAEAGQFLMPLEEISSTPKQSDGGRKRGRETLVVDHNGIATRYDGVEERFTAYYRPSYWTEDDSSVFLGEYPTHEEAADAHNLVALLHEESDAQLILPHTAERYANELRRWEGRHHVDLVCELRLRGRGLLKDGGVNYKHVGRRWSGKKKGTRYFSTVTDDLVSSSNAKTSKAKKTFLTTFDTAEQAAQYADRVLVKRKGVEAWTNFPLSSYIPSKDLPLSFLPISNNFRDNLTYKRTKA